MTELAKKNSPYGPHKFISIDEYHASFPKEIQVLLEQLRKVIQQTAPTAKEVISYNIPTFKLEKNLVHYAAYKKHIGFYPTPKAIEHFKEDFKNYKTSKGAIQFPIDQPLPFELIKKIVLYRLKNS